MVMVSIRIRVRIMIRNRVIMLGYLYLEKYMLSVNLGSWFNYD